MEILPSFVLLFSLSLVIVMVCDRLKLPTILGFLVTGIISGPNGLGLVSHVDDVHQIAEIGVILLLFRIGMKLKLGKIADIKRYFFIAGPLQVGFTAFAGFLIGMILGKPMGESILLGFLLSLSSTAVVFKILEDRGEAITPHAKVMLGILIFQDIAAVLMLLITPHLTSAGLAQLNFSLVVELMKGLSTLIVVFLCAEKIVPNLLYYITKTHRNELFLLSILTICFGVAWMASSLGLSLSLGAFMAGLIIADSEYSSEALGGVIPYQEVFTSFFFVSVGMLFQLGFVLLHPLEVALFTGGIIALKTVIAVAMIMLTGMPLRTSILAGISIAQIGEFSFVLMRMGKQLGIDAESNGQCFMAASVLTMFLTPLLMYLAPLLASIALRLPLPKLLTNGFSPIDAPHEKKEYEDHLVIVGYGYSGSHLSRAAKDAQIPYVILTMNTEVVRAEKKKGEPIYFGDATHDSVLSHVNIEKAKALAVIVNDPVAAERIVSHVRAQNPNIYIIVRTKYMNQIPKLLHAGATEVVPDEFGVSVEIFSHVLHQFKATPDLIDRCVKVVREEGYQMFRPLFNQINPILQKVGESVGNPR
jgi:K+:H+ antiporter